MKFSESWLREWVNPQGVTTQQLIEQLTMAGLEVDAVEPVAGEFNNVVVAEILTAERHPDADKLQVCQVNVGADEPLSIVCGAQNARPGIKIPCAMIGAVLPGNFKIKKSKLRGVASFGMLCSEAELGLAESASGLLELPDDAPVGQDIRSYLQLNDQVIEVDLTPNRGDCLGIRGIAREVSVLCRATYKPLQVSPVAETIADVFPVSVEAKQACPRYLGRVIKGVNSAAVTPLWMVEKLRRSGIRSIDPIVDVTNYVLLELGQPMHAFDLAKLEQGLTVRYARPDESLTLLDGQSITLSDDILVIADAAKPLAMAGVMGGEDSGVSAQTTDIFLECAFFDPIAIAGKARKYGLHTDSSHRFERGVDFEGQQLAMQRATELLLAIVGGEAGPVTEQVAATHLPQKAPIELRRARIAQVLGFVLADEVVADTLQRLGLELSPTDAGWTVAVPSYRFDLEIEVDLIEELARIYGYNKLPTLAPKAELHLQAQPEGQTSLRKVRNLLVARDYQEVITYSFVDRKLQQLVCPHLQSIALENPISADMSDMRTSLWSGLLKTVQYNANRQQSRIRIFETGMRFVQTDDSLLQQPMIAGVITGSRDDESWHGKAVSVDFYDVKADVEALLAIAGQRGGISFAAESHPALHPGQSARLYLNGQAIGWFGAIHPQFAQQLDINKRTYLFEIEQAALLSADTVSYRAVSKYPSIRRDLALLAKETLQAEAVCQCIREAAGALLKDVFVFDVYQGAGVAEGYKSIAVAILLQHPEKTLNEDDISEISARLIEKLDIHLGVSLRE